jgi:hypothetical protein
MRKHYQKIKQKAIKIMKKLRVTKQHVLCTNIILVQPLFFTLLESATQTRFTLIYYSLKFQVTSFSRIFFSSTQPVFEHFSVLFLFCNFVSLYLRELLFL